MLTNLIVVVILQYIHISNHHGLPGSPMVESSSDNVGNTGSIPGPGRFHVPRDS